MASVKSIGNRLAPWRFLLFFGVLAVGWPVAIHWLDWSKALLLGFDAAALCFLVSCAPIFGFAVKRLREEAVKNDANRIVLLVVTFLLSVVIFAAIVGELGQDDITAWNKVLIAATLMMVWLFGNAVYTLHYCHLFYTRDDGGKDCAGLDFPSTRQPLLSDFTYFAYTLGVAVQTSDVCVTSPHIRKVVTAHCIIGFFFNLGVLALTINVLGSK